MWGLKTITRAINLGNSRVMTQEEKQLLLLDLCARLTYGAKITWNGEHWVTVTPSMYSFICEEQEFTWKPYLRPMSSMTSDEVLEYISLKENIVAIDTITYHFETYESIDWLNKKMFAYRTIDGKDMFELGLALEAPEGMYSIKDK